MTEKQNEEDTRIIEFALKLLNDTTRFMTQYLLMGLAMGFAIGILFGFLYGSLK